MLHKRNPNESYEDDVLAETTLKGFFGRLVKHALDEPGQIDNQACHLQTFDQGSDTRMTAAEEVVHNTLEELAGSHMKLEDPENNSTDYMLPIHKGTVTITRHVVCDPAPMIEYTATYISDSQLGKVFGDHVIGHTGPLSGLD